MCYFQGFRVVDLPGFEPRQADPETAVLPLHHKSEFANCSANVMFFT